MEGQKFTWGGALRGCVQFSRKSPAHLAEFYLDRDRMLVYRWMRDEPEVAQVRGAIVGLMPRLSLFAAVRTVLVGSQKKINLETFIKM